jgi:hypothetical protein
MRGFAAVGACWRPALVALTSGNIDVAGRAASDVVVGVVIAAGIGSRRAVALDASGQRVAFGGASCGVTSRGGVYAFVWHHVVAVGTSVGGLRADVGGVDVVGGGVGVGTTATCVDVGWRQVASVRGHSVATSGVPTGGSATCGVATGVGTSVGWRSAATHVGGVVGDVAASGATWWPSVVAGHGGQRVGRTTIGSAFAVVVSWRSAAATGVHGQRIAASGYAFNVAIVAITVAA